MVMVIIKLKVAKVDVLASPFASCLGYSAIALTAVVVVVVEVALEVIAAFYRSFFQSPVA